MGFIVVLQGMRSTSIARRAANALAGAGYDVCLTPQGEQGDLRENVVRCLIAEADAVLSVGGESEGDTLIHEAIGLAARAGKLIEPRASGKSGVAAEPIGQLDAAVVVAAVRSRVGPDRRSRVATEYADFLRSVSGRRASDLRRFLSRYRGGVLHPVAFAAVAEREAQSYRVRDVALPAEEPVWRLRSRHGPSAVIWFTGGVATLAMAMAAVLLTPVGLWVRGERPAAVASVEPDLHVPARAPDIEAVTEGLDVPAVAGALTPPAPVTLRGGEAIAPGPDPAPSGRMAEIAPPVAAPPRGAVATANVSTAPQAADRPAGTTAPARPVMRTTPVYDLANLEPGLRTTVELARRRQAYARAQAQRPQAGRSLVSEAREIRYAGDWADGVASGLGRAEWADGTLYEGTWRRSRPDGMGVMQMANGLRYEGEFAGGAPTGNGVFWSADGRRLKGGALFSALIAARRTTLEEDSAAAR